MTDEIQQWIEEKCTEFEDIQWISKHLDLYRPQTKNHRELDDLEHYGGNIHTWTLEAVQTYRKLQESLCNNPFMVMTEWSKKHIDISLFVLMGALYLLNNLDMQSLLGF